MGKNVGCNNASDAYFCVRMISVTNSDAKHLIFNDAKFKKPILLLCLKDFISHIEV